MKHLPIPIESHHAIGMEAFERWRRERDGSCDRERRQLSADLFFRSPVCILKANPVYVKCCAAYASNPAALKDSGETQRK